MKKLHLTFVILLLALNVFGQEVNNTAVHRIGDYCKLWSVINLFHPEMAYNTINADSLFTNNINELINDPSAASFKHAIQKMLDALQDPHTKIKNNTKSSTNTIYIPSRPLLRWLPDSIALLHFDDRFITQIISSKNTTPLLHLLDSIRNARSLIIDLRKKSFTTDELQVYFQRRFLTEMISLMSNQEASYPAKRTRVHYGHEDETGKGSDIYYKGWLMENGARIHPSRTAEIKPVCLLVNILTKGL